MSRSVGTLASVAGAWPAPAVPQARRGSAGDDPGRDAANEQEGDAGGQEDRGSDHEERRRLRVGREIPLRPALVARQRTARLRLTADDAVALKLVGIDDTRGGIRRGRDEDADAGRGALGRQAVFTPVGLAGGRGTAG